MIGLSPRSILVAFAIACSSVALSAPAHSEDAAPIESRVALSGFDPVAYFTDHQPEKGSEEFSASFDDATYWFKSEEHRAMFMSEPDSYAPQYGGYCAISMSHGKKAEPDPQAWTIADGKLYVFRSPVGVAMFEKDGPQIAGAAAENWPTLKATH